MVPGVLNLHSHRSDLRRRTPKAARRVDRCVGAATMATLGMALSLLGMAVGCSSSTPAPFTLAQPIPVPVVPTPVPDPTPTPTPKPSPTPSPLPASTLPYFNAAPPPEVTLAESQPWTITLQTTNPSGGPVGYFYQCPYACPTGIVISAAGVVSWTPGFGQSGVYDVRFVATNLAGESGESDYIQITVTYVDRPPLINAVTIVPDNPVTPTLVSCVVDKTSPDGNVMTTVRSWTVNGLVRPDLTGLTLPVLSFKAWDVVVCSAVVTDSYGELGVLSPAAIAAGMTSIASAPYTVPNHPPTFVSVAIARADGNANFKVGDTVGCPIATNDVDIGAVVTRVETLVETSGGTVLATKTGDGDIAYKVQKSDAHQLLLCYVQITDSHSVVSDSSAAVQVTNSQPVITGVHLMSAAPQATVLTPVMTGDSVTCTVDFSDPDGDSVFPVVTFLNGSSPRGVNTQTVVSSTLQELVTQYTLLTVSQVASPLSADIHGNAMSCLATVTDIVGAVTTQVSNVVTLADHPPSVAVDPASGPLSQTLATGVALTPVKLDALDPDGDPQTFVKVAGLDSCIDKGLDLEADTSGKVTSTKVPPATYPQSDRSCSVAFVVTSGVPPYPTLTAPLPPLPPVVISVSIPNTPPSVTCTNTTQYLQTGAETFGAIPVAPAGQAVGTNLDGSTNQATQIICTIVDTDLGNTAGLTGKAFDLEWSSTGDPCSHQPNDTDSPPLAGLHFTTISPTVFRVDGTIGLFGCQNELLVSDGDKVSNIVTIDLEPLITLAFDHGTDFDNACYLTVTGTPAFGGGYSYLTPVEPVPGSGAFYLPQPPMTSSVAAATFSGGSPALPMVLSETGITTQLVEPYLGNDNFGQAFDLHWVMGAALIVSDPVLGSKTYVTTRDISREWVVTSGPPADGNVYPWHPQLTAGADTGVGRQVAPAAACVKANACTGARSSIAAGDQHTCVVGAVGGLVYCWGANDQRQLGDQVIDPVSGLPAKSSVPMTVKGLSGAASMVAAGYKHNCALMVGGTVRCWGSNLHGQLGVKDNSLPPGALPGDSMPTPNLSSLTYVAVPPGGGVFSAVQFPNVLAGSSGGGLDTAMPVLSAVGCAAKYPTPPTASFTIPHGCPALGDPAIGPSVIQIVAGDNHSCALMADGTVMCWGANDAGQLGQISNAIACSVATAVNTTKALCTAAGVGGLWGCNGEACSTNPVAVQNADGSTFSGAVSIGAGGSATCAAKLDGSEWCWGESSYGQLGNGTQDQHLTPFPVTGLAGVWEIAMGPRAGCAIQKGGRTLCWGVGDLGELGQGDQTITYAPDVTTYDSGTAAIGIGNDFGCAVTASGNVECYGNNYTSATIYGQLGTGSGQTSSLAKARVQYLGSDLQNHDIAGVQALALGYEHACAVLLDGSVTCWGEGDNGQLGNGSFTSSNVAATVGSGSSLATVQSCPLVYKLNQQ